MGREHAEAHAIKALCDPNVTRRHDHLTDAQSALTAGCGAG